MGNILSGIAGGLTPQNNFSVQAPLNVQALQQQLSQSQGNFQQLQGQQQNLAQALQSQAQGQGPNPAQAMLNQATNQNIQQNTGMIASQKGIDPALAARMAATNQASAGQQAAGQAATMNANQQLGAQQALGSLYGNMSNQNLQNASSSGQLANQSALGADQINAGVAAQNAAATQSTASGLLGGVAGAGMKMAGLAHGGLVQHFDSGGTVDPMANFTVPTAQTAAPTPQAQPAPQQASPMSASQAIANSILQAGGVQMYANGVKPLNLNFKGPTPSAPGVQTIAGGAGDAMGGAAAGGAGGAADLASAAPLVMAAAHGGVIPPHIHGIAQVYHPNFQANQKTALLKSDGGKVPGKAKVQGDSPKNDTVPTMLSPGELVIPRSVMDSKDPAKEASKFVAAKLKESGKYSKNPHGDFKVALKQAIGARGKK